MILILILKFLGLLILILVLILKKMGLILKIWVVRERLVPPRPWVFFIDFYSFPLEFWDCFLRFWFFLIILGIICKKLVYFNKSWKWNEILEFANSANWAESWVSNKAFVLLSATIRPSKSLYHLIKWNMSPFQKKSIFWETCTNVIFSQSFCQMKAVTSLLLNFFPWISV